MKRTILILLIAAAALLNATGEDMVVHEWGTFTSVQGSDGVLLEWNPFQAADLPAFVYDRAKPGAQFQLAQNRSPEMRVTKSGVVAFQRMETPVLYFYTGRETDVDVTVRFPEGLITEWYPQVRDFGPQQAFAPDAKSLRNGFLRWGRVHLMPSDRSPQLAREIPVDSSGSHYFAARETDSAYVRLCSLSSDVRKPEYEKFLFYRGVGNFPAPLRVAATSDNRITVENTGHEDLTHLFVLDIRGQKGGFLPLNQLKAGERSVIHLEDGKNALPLDEVAAQLSKKMEESLIAQGLYPREARAMVNTWKDSWFSENGTRVLYLLPDAWTSRTLPLTLSPVPKELVRVMVGRAEVITLHAENEILQHLRRLTGSKPGAHQQALVALQKLGRFAEPTLRRVAHNSADPGVRAHAEKLLRAMTTVP